MESENTQYPITDVEEALGKLFGKEPLVTTKDVAKEVGCGTETARIKLWELVEADSLRTRNDKLLFRIVEPMKYASMNG